MEVKMVDTLVQTKVGWWVGKLADVLVEMWVALTEVMMVVDSADYWVALWAAQMVVM